MCLPEEILQSLVRDRTYSNVKEYGAYVVQVSQDGKYAIWNKERREHLMNGESEALFDTLERADFLARHLNEGNPIHKLHLFEFDTTQEAEADSREL